MKYQNFINGLDLDPMGDGTFGVPWATDPSRQAEVVASSAIDVVKTIQVSKAAEAKWLRADFEQRKLHLMEFGQALAEGALEYSKAEAEQIGLDSGFLLQHSYHYAIKRFQDLVGESETENFLPLGCCVLVIPWELSLRVFVDSFIAAILSGNTLIVKIPEQNPVVGRAIAEALKKSSFPEGVCNLLQGRDEDLLPTLVAHPAILGVDFTGSFSQADRLLPAMSQMGKRIRLRTGGKNSAVLFDDVDFNAVLPELLKSCLLAGGQLRQSVSRVFVSTKRQLEFINALKSYVESAAGQTQLESLHASFTASQREDSYQAARDSIVKEGGKLIALNHQGKEWACFIHDLTMCSEVQQDELRLPIILIAEYKYTHEAEKWVNTGYLGLAAQLWSMDKDRALKLAQRLRVGTVWLNTWFDEAGEADWGQKSSSVGYDGPDLLSKFYRCYSQILTN